MKDIKRYNYIEFYHEQMNLKNQIRDIRTNLKTFNIYMPKYQMKVEDMPLAINQIKDDIRERLNHFFKETDHNFALGNYEYITKTLQNEPIIKIYRQLGPFDFYQESGIKAETDENIDQRSLNDKFEQRRSGAMFRGEISNVTGKPEGRGIKIFPNGSIYEGNFSEGHT